MFAELINATNLTKELFSDLAEDIIAELLPTNCELSNKVMSLVRYHLTLQELSMAISKYNSGMPFDIREYPYVTDMISAIAKIDKRVEELCH